MGSMQIRVGIWFFSMDMKGEVMRRRGQEEGQPLPWLIWRPRPYPCSSHLWPWGWGEKLESMRGVKELLKEKNWVLQHEEKMRERMRKSWKENWREREKGMSTRWIKEERKGGVSLSLLLVTPSQLPGFIESFLSWCCFLIDIKMHWPVCQHSPSPPLYTHSPPFTL